MNIAQLKFLRLDLTGVETLVDWARQEGWNPGTYDAAIFYKTDPDGFYGYFLKGELIAGGSIVSYDGQFGFMGFFIVRPEYRSLGIGKKLWYKRRDTLLSRLHKGASIGMDGVLAMQPFYSKGGFKIAFRDERYEKIGSSYNINQHISFIEKKDFNTILNYDTQCFGLSRLRFIDAWLQLPESKTFKYVEKGILKGYVMIRKVTTGYKICPLFADNEVIAEELYKACLNTAIGEPVYIDIPLINQKAVNLIKKYDAHYVFECARMYYGIPPKMELNRIYGITTFELG